MATFVLAPPAWCGGWIWEPVATLLHAAGHRVFSPTPTGMDERSADVRLGIGLQTHIDDIVSVLETNDLHDCILVGWSQAGMLIAGTADRVPERVAQLVFGDAIVPSDGQSYYDADPNGAVRLAVDQAEIDATGTTGFRPVPVEYIRERIDDEATCAWVLANVVPHPMATLTQPIRLDNPATAAIPRAFIFCTKGKDANAQTVQTAARVRDDPSWRYWEVADYHLALITSAQEVATVLLQLP